MKMWQIQTLLCNGDWEDTSEEPYFYHTKKEALQNLHDFVLDCKMAVEVGDMEDFDRKDWRVAEVEVE